MDLENGLEGYRHQKTRGCRENSEVIYDITIPGAGGRHVSVKFVKICLCDQRQVSFWSEMSLCLLSICAHLPELSCVLLCVAPVWHCVSLPVTVYLFPYILVNMLHLVAAPHI